MKKTCAMMTCFLMMSIPQHSFADGTSIMEKLRKSSAKIYLSAKNGEYNFEILDNISEKIINDKALLFQYAALGNIYARELYVKHFAPSISNYVTKVWIPKAQYFKDYRLSELASPYSKNMVLFSPKKCIRKC